MIYYSYMPFPFTQKPKRQYHRKLTSEDRKANSPLAGIILVLAVAGFVGFFAFSSQAKQSKKEETPTIPQKTIESKKAAPAPPAESKEVPSRSAVVLLGEVKEVTPQTLMVTTIAPVGGIDTEKDFSITITKDTTVTHQEKKEDEGGQAVFISKKGSYKNIQKGDFVQVKTKDDILSQTTVNAESIDYSEFNPLLP